MLFASWSNVYDGNIGKAVKGKQIVIDYASANNISIPPAKIERSWQSNITINIRGENITGIRRHDIFIEIENRAIEVKNYSSQKVNLSFDIEKEALMDIKLMQNDPDLIIEWVFTENGPSAPLKKLLENGGIIIKP